MNFGGVLLRRVSYHVSKFGTIRSTRRVILARPTSRVRRRLVARKMKLSRRLGVAEDVAAARGVGVTLWTRPRGVVDAGGVVVTSVGRYMRE